MNQICIFIILIILILLLLSLVGLRENLEMNYKINPNFRPYSTTNPDINLSKSGFPNSVNFKPWYKPWTNGPSKMYCYVNNHLQRRCFWKCDNNYDQKNCN